MSEEQTMERSLTKQPPHSTSPLYAGKSWRK